MALPLEQQLASRATPHGGVPVGAVLLTPRHVEPLRRVLGPGVKFRGVQRPTLPGDSVVLVLVHLADASRL